MMHQGEQTANLVYQIARLEVTLSDNMFLTSTCDRLDRHIHVLRWEIVVVTYLTPTPTVLSPSSHILTIELTFDALPHLCSRKR